MNRNQKIALGIIGGAAGIAALAALASSDKSRQVASAPVFDAMRKKPFNAVRGMPVPQGYAIEYFESGEVSYSKPDGKPISWGSQSAWILQRKLAEDWERRAATLPPDADALKPDRYSKELYVYRATVSTPDLGYGTYHDNFSAGGVCLIDEFGRKAECLSASGNGVLVILQTIADYALPVVALVVPGYGTALYGAYLMVKSVAAGGDWKDVALAAARSQIPPGPAQAAFDFGVAVVLKGESLPQAAETAALGQMSEGERQAYYHGKAAAEAGLAGNYGQATQEALAAYYTPR